MSFNNIPQELKDLKQWVCWKGVLNDKGKLSKIPINAKTGGGAMSNNPETWTDYETALAAAEKFKYNGIGFMFSNGYFGVDLDNCSEELKDEFIKVLDSYTEVSYSGNGIHIICKGKLPEGPRRKANIEMYDSNRFFVMTGKSIHTQIINERNEQIKELFNKYLKADEYQYKKVAVTGPTLEDGEIVRKASASKNGNLFTLLLNGNWEGLTYQSQSEADMAFAMMLAFWTNKNPEQIDRIFRSSGLIRPKWDEKRGRDTYGNITIENAIKKTAIAYDPNYDSKLINYNPTTGEVGIDKNESFDPSDTGNAQRLVKRYGDQIKYNFENKQWLLWAETHWRNDATNQIKVLAENVIEEMENQMLLLESAEAQKELLKNISRAYSTSGKDAMIKESQHIMGVPCVNADFDKQHFLLNTLSGVVDLQSGKLMQHTKELMLSKLSHIQIDINEPKLWLKFLDEIFMGDKELIKFIQKAVGYTLTGSIKEQCMFILFGDGANGKSVFLDVISTMLGDYGVNAQVDTILAKKGNGNNANSDLARLKGARMATTSEPNEGSKFNEGLIKQLTGGDTITARFLYGKEFEFRPEFKLWLATNYKPVIRGTDQGIWRRIRLIPFEYKIPKEKQDKNITEKLLQELPQIINWAIQGALLWQKEGLESPASINDATKEYRNEMDIINTFVDECCQIIPNYETPAQEVYNEYSEWSKRGNEYLMSLTRFGKEMAKRFDKKKTRNGVVYMNLRLSKNDTSYVYTKVNT